MSAPWESHPGPRRLARDVLGSVHTRRGCLTSEARPRDVAQARHHEACDRAVGALGEINPGQIGKPVQGRVAGDGAVALEQGGRVGVGFEVVLVKDFSDDLLDEVFEVVDRTPDGSNLGSWSKSSPTGYWKN